MRERFRERGRGIWIAETEKWDRWNWSGCKERGKRKRERRTRKGKHEQKSGNEMATERGGLTATKNEREVWLRERQKRGR